MGRSRKEGHAMLTIASQVNEFCVSLWQMVCKRLFELLARHKRKNLTEACNFDQIYTVCDFFLLGNASLIGVKTNKCIWYSVWKVKDAEFAPPLKRKIMYLKTCMSNKLDRIRSYWNAIIQMYIDFVQHSHNFFTSILFYLCPTFSLFSLEYIGKGFKSMSHV